MGLGYGRVYQNGFGAVLDGLGCVGRHRESGVNDDRDAGIFDYQPDVLHGQDAVAGDYRRTQRQHGRAADTLQAFGQNGCDAGVGNLQPTVIELSGSGDMAHEVGTYTLTIQPEEGGAISDNGKYVVIWKRENDTWKLDVEIWNSSVPLPAAEVEEEDAVEE